MLDILFFHRKESAIFVRDDKYKALNNLENPRRKKKEKGIAQGSWVQ